MGRYDRYERPARTDRSNRPRNPFVVAFLATLGVVSVLVLVAIPWVLFKAHMQGEQIRADQKQRELQRQLQEQIKKDDATLQAIREGRYEESP